ncbi:MAG: pyridoxal phosphate-dependent aminotransferase [Deltaproteobacteria bacterium]|nr:pyridoxal phosphate-dependent aminotransferase [Deltaproteobacteria bacterium]
MQPARRLQQIKPSPTLALNAKARALAAQGVDVVGFAAGEPDYDTPAFIKDAAVEALRQGFTKYTATAGIPELRAAVREKFQRDNGLTYAPEQVLITVGAKQALYNFFQAVLDPGDEVIIFAPYWVSYPDMVRLAGGEPVVVETREEDGWVPSPDALRAALTPRTRAVVFNSPSNPTGAVLSRKDLEALGQVILPHGCLVVSDDIYEPLVYGDTPFCNIVNAVPALQDRALVVNGFSKSHSMTGWRLGYAAGPAVLVSAMTMVQDQSTSNAASIVQKAGLAALGGSGAELREMRAEYLQRRDLVVSALNAIPGIRCRTPDGAFYVMANVKGLLGKSYKGQVLGSALRMSELLLSDFQVAAVPGEPFGAPGYLRLSFVTSREKLQKGLSRIAAFAAALG